MLNPTSHYNKFNEAPMATAVNPKWPVIRLNVQRRRFRGGKHFTAKDGTWIESCIRKHDALEDNSETNKRRKRFKVYLEVIGQIEKNHAEFYNLFLKGVLSETELKLLIGRHDYALICSLSQQRQQ